MLDKEPQLKEHLDFDFQITIPGSLIFSLT